MCKSSCCPGTSGSGGGPAVTAVIAIVIIAAVARLAAHAALAVLHAAITIAIITVATLSGLAVLTAAALVIRRARHAHLTIPARPPAITPVRASVPVTGRTPLALTPPPPARCQHAAADPELVAQIIAAILRGRHD